MDTFKPIEQTQLPSWYSLCQPSPPNDFAEAVCVANVTNFHDASLSGG
ncbi:hypothetical protein [Neorhodopirellula lusitana]